MDNLIVGATIAMIIWSFLLILVVAALRKRWWSVTLWLLAAPGSTALIIGSAIYFNDDSVGLLTALIVFLTAAVSGTCMED